MVIVVVWKGAIWMSKAHDGNNVYSLQCWFGLWVTIEWKSFRSRLLRVSHRKQPLTEGNAGWEKFFFFRHENGSRRHNPKHI